VIVQLLGRREEGYPQVSNLVLLGFCGYVIIWYLQIGYRIPFLGEIRIEFIWALVLTAIALMTSGRPKLMDNPLSGVVILLLLAMAVQVPMSYVPQHSWDVFYNRVIKFAFMAFFIVNFARSPKGLILFIGAFMLASLKMGQEGFIGQITGSMVWENQGVMRLNGSTPLYAHPNSFSGMAIGTIPFLIYLFPIAPKVVKMLLAVQFIFAINIIIHTGSRTGYVAFVMLLILIFLDSNKKIKSLLIFIFVSLVAVHFIDQQYVARFNTITTGNEIEGNSIDTRKEILFDAFEVFQKNPFGVGVAAFPEVRNRMFGRFQDTHNLYLEIATNLGIQGFFVFVMLIYKLFQILRKIKSNVYEKKIELLKFLVDVESSKGVKNKIIQQINDLKFIEAMVKAVYYFIIMRLALGLFGMDLYEIYWWFAIGLTIALHEVSSIAMVKAKILLEPVSTNFVLNAEDS
jgi:putative inorganic carbon (hco3(-)) transporter